MMSTPVSRLIPSPARLVRHGMIVVAALCSAPALANIVVSGTRVVFPSEEREVTIKLNNAGDLPALVQAWVDAGNPASTPDNSVAPFVLTPPLVRVDPGKGQALRMTYTGEPLPPDRESLFWLNVLDVPPKPEKKAGAENTLQFAIRSRLKIFFRPKDLPGSSLDAPALVQWRLVPAKGAAGYTLQISNPTPYYVTFTEVELVSGDRSAKSRAGGMLMPQGYLSMPFSDFRASAAGDPVEVNYTFINDYGAPVTQKGTLSP